VPEKSVTLIGDADADDTAAMAIAPARLPAKVALLIFMSKLQIALSRAESVYVNAEGRP
jgi:hypothetical protein